VTDDDPRLDVAAFDAVSALAALELVRPACASPAWQDALVARRPYRTFAALADISDAVIADLSPHQLARAAGAEVADDARGSVAATVRDRLASLLR
jgi:hypothetical protein